MRLRFFYLGLRLRSVYNWAIFYLRFISLLIKTLVYSTNSYTLEEIVFFLIVQVGFNE